MANATLRDDETLQAAAHWWIRLRDPSSTAVTVEQWLEWTRKDERNLAAFERVNELGLRVGRIDAVTRQRFIEQFAPPVAPSRRLRPLVAAAAAAALALLGGYLAWQRSSIGPTPQVYASSVAQNRDITLPDGSKVALGAASKLTARFGHGQRDVELSAGEAFFQVAHDAQRPFVVTAGTLSIRDLGTAFDVRRTGQRVSIAITEGRVKVSDSNAPASKGASPGALEAGAGQLISYDPATSAMRLSRIAPEQAAAWRDARLEFIDEPLSMVIANVNRYSSRQVRIADADLAALTFTGTVRTDAIDSWLDALPQVFPLRVNAHADQVILSREQRPPPR